MSIFWLPIGLVKDLSAMVSKFWWGCQDGNRKICWIKWERLCLPKSLGGLGFRNLALFNQALLANQVWRIFRNPGALASKILGAKYFNKGDVLTAPIKNGNSYIWRSLVWGRSLLLKGLRWRVGNGRSIRVFHDPWLPRPSTFRPISSDPGFDLRVSDLIARNHMDWDHSKLNQFLLPIDRSIVTSIPISTSGGQDFLSWHYDKAGRYSVKSGYRLAILETIRESSSNVSLTKKWWNTLWRLNIPPKVRVFMWRACLNALPSLTNLWSRKVVEERSCVRCLSAIESSEHALFWCPESRKVWGRTRFDCFFDSLPPLSVLDTVSLFWSSHSIDDLNLFCMVVWAVWDHRNLFSLYRKDLIIEQVVSKAEVLLEEYQHSISVITPVGGPSARPPPCGDWIPPRPGCLKLNSAAISHKFNGCSALGAVIRDDKGTIIAACARKIFGVFSKESGVLLALRDGLLLAQFLGVPVWVAEIDFSPVCSLLHSPDSYFGDASFLIQDVIHLMSAVGVSSCQSISKEGNFLACNLGISAFKSSTEILLLDNSFCCMFSSSS
ncbi:hypothetical protein Q3G72_022047 [Acer saccharum]|nr:hypothetical protein Q3G72_022047 [Acer saccharum]